MVFTLPDSSLDDPMKYFSHGCLDGGVSSMLVSYFETFQTLTLSNFLLTNPGFVESNIYVLN